MNKNKKMMEFTSEGTILIPSDEAAREFVNSLNLKQKVYLKETSEREYKFHKAYFQFLNYCYNQLPASFKAKIAQNYFYIFLKELQGRYKIIYTMKNGSQIKEYDSISFESMSQLEFENYVKEQLPIIYDLFYTLYNKGMADRIIKFIEIEFKNFLAKL